MRRLLAATLFALALAFLLPPLLSPARTGEGPAPTAAPEETDAPAGDGLTLRVKTGEGVETMAMADYLTLALAAEMPASFAPEALKAQAVALRSYALHYRAAPKAVHPEADVCSDPGCCAAMLTETELRERWGERYDEYRASLRRAVAETDGQTLCWEGQPILAVFHASSQGSTENGEALGLSAPYLVSVSTPETPETVNGLDTTVEVAPEDLAATLGRLDPEAAFSGAPESWLGPVRLDDAGRVSAVALGGRSFSALTLRQAFALRSTDFTLTYDGAKFVFRVRGYGHGLGLSQHGANLMAKSGADYREILAHYYPETSLSMSNE